MQSFAPGDVVKVVSPDFQEFFGRQGTVTNIGSKIEIVFNDGKEPKKGWFMPDELTKVSQD